MSFRQKKASEEGFSLYAEKIENLKSLKYLGIIPDQRLNFPNIAILSRRN